VKNGRGERRSAERGLSPEGVLSVLPSDCYVGIWATEMGAPQERDIACAKRQLLMACGLPAKGRAAPIKDRFV
jgi:hypothetical protein